jgi:hypothetical protein
VSKQVKKLEEFIEQLLAEGKITKEERFNALKTFDTIKRRVR